MPKGSKSKGSRSFRDSRTSRTSRSMNSLNNLRNSVSSVNDKVITTLNPVQTNPIEEIQNRQNFTSGYNILIFFLYIINIVINIYALLWIQKLEQISCKCSDNWKRDYIKYFIYVYFGFLILQVITYLATGHGLMEQDSAYVIFFVSVYNVFALIAMIVAIMYIDELKAQKCSCSEDIWREVYYYYNVIRLAIFGLIFLLSLVTILFVGRLVSRFSSR